MGSSRHVRVERIGQLVWGAILATELRPELGISLRNCLCEYIRIPFFAALGNSGKRGVPLVYGLCRRCNHGDGSTAFCPAPAELVLDWLELSAEGIAVAAITRRSVVHFAILFPDRFHPEARLG